MAALRDANPHLRAARAAAAAAPQQQQQQQQLAQQGTRATRIATAAVAARGTTQHTRTHSLPDTAYLIFKQEKDLRRGDYVAFRWHGGGPYLAGVKFTKIVRGVPGDVVSIQGQDVFINGQYVSTAKHRATTGQPLQIGFSGVIPPGHYYVHGTDKDSLDSRYALTGWIKAEAVVGKARPLF